MTFLPEPKEEGLLPESTHVVDELGVLVAKLPDRKLVRRGALTASRRPRDCRSFLACSQSHIYLWNSYYCELKFSFSPPPYFREFEQHFRRLKQKS